VTVFSFWRVPLFLKATTRLAAERYFIGEGHTQPRLRRELTVKDKGVKPGCAPVPGRIGDSLSRARDVRRRQRRFSHRYQIHRQ
jgi:hypothetical protein